VNYLQKKTILLFEDEEISAFLSKRILQVNNYSVVHVSTGEEAVSVALENDSIDLVLMDIDLGAGIDGTVAAQRILANRDVPLVFMSSHTEKEVVEKTEGITSYGYIVKNSGETVFLASLRMAFKLFEQKCLVIEKENALIEREQLFSAFMDNIPLMAIIKDENSKPIYYNKLFIEKFPLDAQNGSVTVDIFTRNQLEIIRKSDDLAFKNGLHQYEETILTKNGEVLYLDVFKFLIARQGLSKKLGVIIHDITEKKQALLAHAQTSEQLQASLSNTPNVAIQWYTEDGKVIFWNSASEKMYGWEEKDALGKTLDQLIYTKVENVAFLEIIQSIKKTGKPYGPFETEIKHKDGSIGWVLATTFAIPLDSNTMGYVCMDVDISRLKRIQQDLLIKESALAYSLQAVAIADMNGFIIYVNPAFLTLWTYTSSEEVLGKHLIQFWKNKGDAKVIQQQVANASTWTGILTAKRSDSTTFTAETTINYIKNEQDAPTFILVSTIDISKKVHIEQELHDNRKMLQLVLDSIPQAIFIKDRNGMYVDCNDAFVKQIEAPSKEAILGKTDRELIHSTFESTYFRLIDEEVMSSGVPKLKFEERLTKSDGNIYWLQTSKIPLFNDNEEVSGVIGIFEEITERKKNEEKIRLSELLYRSIFEKNSAIKLVINPVNGEIIDANDAATLFYGYPKKDLLNLKISDINILSEEEIQDEMNLALLEKRLNFKFKHRIANGDIRDVDVYSGPIEVDGQNLLHSIVFDVTDRMKAEKQIIELLKQKDYLLKEAHHRVKNNMNTIFNLLSIQSEQVENEQAQNILIDAASRTHSMMILYDKLYRSENFGTLNIKDFLPDLIRDVTEIFQPIHKVKTSISIDSIEMHSNQLSSLGIIINELITNSMKHAFKQVLNPEIRISLLNNDHQSVTFSYEDNGTGLPESLHFENRSGFGMQLIGIMIKHLKGKGEIIRDKTTSIQIEIPII
jgi:PAS domain S-box-containing protein